MLGVLFVGFLCLSTVLRLLLPLLLLLPPLMALALCWLIGGSTFWRGHSVFEMRDLLSQVNHERITSWEVFLEKFTISLLQLNLEPTTEDLLLAPLSRVIFPLQDVGFAHLVASVVQDHLDLLKCWVLTAFLQRNPPTLVDALLAVEVGRVDADKSLRVGVEFVWVEGSELRLRRTPDGSLVGSQTCYGGHYLVSCRSE